MSRNRDDYVAMAAKAMADWARRHEPLRLTPQTFRELAGVALDATTLLAARSVPTRPSTGTDDGGMTLEGKERAVDGPDADAIPGAGHD